jgi:hypothetical protein
VCLESIGKKTGESALIWHKNAGAVQRKVDRANMLIQVRFLKVRGGQKEAIFSAAEALETMRQSAAETGGA